jgi:hypothetical protein
VLERAGLVLSQDDDLSGTLGKSFEHPRALSFSLALLGVSDS